MIGPAKKYFRRAFGSYAGSYLNQISPFLPREAKAINLYNGKKNGYFVEVGIPLDPAKSSTFLLERCFGWKGVCIDHDAPKLNQVLEYRLCDFVEKTVGMIENKYLNVQTLTQILAGLNSPRFIEYLTLNVVSGQLSILKGLDFKKYTFGYINFNPTNCSQVNRDIYTALMANGYIMHSTNVDDADFIHCSLDKHLAGQDTSYYY